MWKILRQSKNDTFQAVVYVTCSCRSKLGKIDTIQQMLLFNAFKNIQTPLRGSTLVMIETLISRPLKTALHRERRRQSSGRRSKPHPFKHHKRLSNDYQWSGNHPQKGTIGFDPGRAGQDVTRKFRPRCILLFEHPLLKLQLLRPKKLN